VFFNFAIIAFYGIGRILVFFRFFAAIIAFYSIGQDIGIFLVFFAIIAFCGIGRILVLILSDLLKLTDIGSFDGSSQTLD
jgi:hypothetical protein